jgi:hypothetical protein
MFQEPDENAWIFRWLIDTYNEGFDYITNYVFAENLSTPSLAEHIKKGHLYTAFKTLGDAKGFNFFTVGDNEKMNGIMGDSVQVGGIKSIQAVTPLPGRYLLFYNGKIIKTTSVDGYEFTYTEPLEKGAYRIEVHVNIGGKYLPWIYSNPVYVF